MTLVEAYIEKVCSLEGESTNSMSLLKEIRGDKSLEEKLSLIIKAKE